MNPAEQSNSSPLLEMRGIEKSFPGVKALSGVDLTVHRGEVLALLGENGAGKSTLMKVLGGAHQPDRGTILIDGHETTYATPHDSQQAGVSIIYQEFNLIPALTVRENLFLEEKRRREVFCDDVKNVNRLRRYSNGWE